MGVLQLHCIIYTSTMYECSRQTARASGSFELGSEGHVARLEVYQKLPTYVLLLIMRGGIPAGHGWMH